MTVSDTLAGLCTQAVSTSSCATSLATISDHNGPEARLLQATGERWKLQANDSCRR